MKVGINGLGRIGRAIYRRSLEMDDIEICIINEANPDIRNIAYTLNYDTIYGPLRNPVVVDGDNLVVEGEGKIAVTNHSKISDVPWNDYDVDYVIESTGLKSNVSDSHTLINQNVCRRVFVTHAPSENVDFTMVLGCNENLIDIQKHKVIATSICDATAIAPIMELLDQKIGIKAGHVTTLHPWLSYQNLMDGSSSSWSVPGEIYHHYALGRSVVGNLIPKPTSAITATTQVLSRIKEESIGSFSYRTPTAIVGSADLTLNLAQDVSVDDVNDILTEFKNNQKWDILQIMADPLVSLDFVNNPHSAVVDSRWTSVVGGNLLKMVLWYDNEAGYSMRVLDQIKHVASLEKIGV
jgi:glyceraldehyde 3-phosphate dehydrogenase